MSESPKPMYGVWSLTRPDGKTYLGQTPSQCVSLEQRERIPPEIALERSLEPATPTPYQIDAARWRRLRDMDWYADKMCVVADPKAIKLGTFCPFGDELDSMIDSAMQEPKT